MSTASLPQVTIDCFPESVAKYGEGWAVVAVDVIRATTTAVTAVATGRRCFPVPTVAAAHAQAALLPDALLAGEQAGILPDGFEEQNSPAALATRPDVHRPLVLLTSAGTRLLQDVQPGQARYAACLRNLSATVAEVAAKHDRVAVIGAGTKGEFREEDALCCAWIAGGLMEAGFRTDPATAAMVERWATEPVEAITRSKSVDYLRRTDQLADLQFVLTHLEDLDTAYAVQAGELVAVSAPSMSLPVGAA
jgi:2-phosphosulfolactate phosphatase